MKGLALGAWALLLAGAASAAGAQTGVTVPTLPAERPAATPGEQRCLDAFRADTTRIERDLSRRVPPKGDPAAQQAFAAEMHTLLQQAGDRAEACSRAARAPRDAAMGRAAEACAQRARLASDIIEGRYGRRTLTAAEQTARRSEELRMMDERQACLVAATKQ